MTRTRIAVRSRGLVALVLFALTVATFWKALFMPGDRVLSGRDIFHFFLYWRAFGFGQMKAGHLALWNPYIFSGSPFVGGFQSELFYPPNLIYLILPLARAINCELALHVFLMGLFMSLWVEHYGLHPLAALLAGSIVMFGGAFFPHVYAGHLAPLDTMTWAPLALLAVDGLLDEPGPRFILLGIFGFAMQLLAGFPLVLFQTVVTCALYGAIRIIRAPRPIATIVGAALVAVGSASITAVQLWTGLQTLSEGTRHGGASFAFVASFSLPPHNLLTLAVPGLFGNMTGFPYWGRTFLFESSLFLGLTGLTMALFGASLKFRRKGVWIAMIGLLLVLALGRYTRLLRFLYRHAPGFNLFRSYSEFSLEAGLFAAMLAAFGIDGVIRSARGAKKAAALLLIGAALLGTAGICLRLDPWNAFDSIWNACFTAIRSQDVFPVEGNPVDLVAAARRFGGSQCLISALILLALAAGFFWRAFRPGAAYLLAVFGIAEVFLFAHSWVVTFPVSDGLRPELRAFVEAHPGDYRTLGLSNLAMITGPGDIFGYDPVALRRYADFIRYSQGNTSSDAANVIPDVKFNYSPFFRLVRLKYIFSKDANGYHPTEVGGALPHLLLVDDWRQIDGRDRVLEALSAPSFDPEKTVILETRPDPLPVTGGSPGTMRLVGSNTNSLTIEAEITHSSLLLVTDSYSRYWRAVAMPGSSQRHYDVLPADWTLIAVPLAAGKHLFHLEYAPAGYTIGRWISLASLLAYLATLGIFLWGARSQCGASKRPAL